MLERTQDLTMDECCTRPWRDGTIDDQLSELTGVLANERIRLRWFNPQLGKRVAKPLDSLEGRGRALKIEPGQTT
jgi:hypothetical protein